MDEQNTEGEGFVERRRSIRNVTLDEEPSRERERFTKSMSSSGGPQQPTRRRRGTKYAGYVIGGFIILILIFSGFLATSYFSKATITIVPKSQTVTANEDFAVSQDPSDGLALAYEVFSIDDETETTLKGGSEKEVERKATGQITIYNTAGRENQALIANTRFKSEDGNIYRIANSVVVPGVRSDGSPGSLTVTVTSDKPGKEYNLSKGRFTIPGLEGTDLYDAMYAEVKEPIEGGFIGKVLTVDEDEERDAQEANREKLKKALDAKIAESLPQEYIFVPESTVYEFTDLPNEPTGDSVLVKTRGTLYGIMFKQDLLAGYLASQYVDGYDNQKVIIKNPSDLVFSIKGGKVELSDIQDELEMTISGTISLEWVVDTATVKTKLAGVSRDAFQKTISAIPGVKDALLELVPAFRRSIPTNIDKINVLLEEKLKSANER